MADLVLTEEEKEERSYLNWDDESLGKFVKKKAIEFEDYYGEEVSEREAAIISLLSKVREETGDMAMMEVEGVTIDGEDFGQWRITFEKVDPNLPGGPPTGGDDESSGSEDDGGDGGGVLVP